MADDQTSHHSDGADQETDSAREDRGDLDAEIERRDRLIEDLQNSLDAERQVTKGLHANIRELDDRIGNLGDGLIDRLGTCRDLQSMLAEEKARMQAGETDSAQRDASPAALPAEADQRSLELGVAQQRLDELADGGEHSHARFSKTDRATVPYESGSDGTIDNGRLREGEVYSLDELMAETTVLTDEDREREELNIAELNRAQATSREPVEMVSPAAMMSRASPDDALPSDQSEHDQVTGNGLATLVITVQGRHQIKYPLHEGEITIGRSNENDIQINSEFVSRVHARIVTNGSGAVIEDVSSKNGVLLDSDPVTQHTFRDGDVVVLGTTLISFFASTGGAS